MKRGSSDQLRIAWKKNCLPVLESWLQQELVVVQFALAALSLPTLLHDMGVLYLPMVDGEGGLVECALEAAGGMELKLHGQLHMLATELPFFSLCLVGLVELKLVLWCVTGQLLWLKRSSLWNSRKSHLLLISCHYVVHRTSMGTSSPRLTKHHLFSQTDRSTLALA
jgi:hypothetical protein